MNNEERIELLETAQQQINEAADMIAEALRGTNDQSHADAYIIPHLRTWADSGNRFDKGAEQYAESIREGETYSNDDCMGSFDENGNMADKRGVSNEEILDEHNRAMIEFGGG